MGIINMYMIRGIGVDLRELWGIYGFWGGTLGFFRFFGRNKGSLG